MHAILRRIVGVLTITVLPFVMTGCTRERPTPSPTATFVAVEASTPATTTTALEPQVTSTTPQPSGVLTGTLTAESSATPATQQTFQYTVQPGDTLTSIAAQFGTDVQTLTALNNLIGDILAVGQPLYVPYVPTPTPSPYQYTVQPGDTLSGIAARFGVDQIKIMEANNNLLDANSLTVGMSITIPDYQPPAASAATAAQPAATGAAPNAVSSEQMVTHVVQPGESLGEIADKYGVSASAIAAANNITNRNVLRVGQELNIPGITPQQAAAARGTTHIVQPGETLYSIAVRYGVTVDEILKVNKIDNPDAISVGEELVIPGQ